MSGKAEELGLEPEREEALSILESSLGYEFEDRTLLLTALRHRSFVHQFRAATDEEPLPEDNQRLEFLGDAVLSLCVGALLYQSFPGLKEGELSKMRAGLVNEVQLADMARQIGVPGGLLVGRGEEASGGRDKNSILADALEAILAAVYLDKGFNAAMGVVENLWRGLIARYPGDDLLQDSKTSLQELTQRLFGLIPEYRLTGSEGPDHARTFEVTLVLGGKELSTGRGRSKKEAEKEAARAGLESLKKKDESQG